MHVKTILNRIEKQPGFIYESCKWRDSGSPALVITLRPQVGSKPVCSRCGERRPGYDTLRARSFEFVPLCGESWFSSFTLQGGYAAQPAESRSKKCHGPRGKATSP